MLGPGLFSVEDIIDFLANLGWKGILGSIIAGTAVATIVWFGSKAYHTIFANSVDQQEWETTIKYIAESVAPLEDQLEQHREKLGQDPMGSDITEFPEIDDLLELRSAASRDLEDKSPEIAKKMDKYNNYISEYKRKREQLRRNIFEYLLNNPENPFSPYGKTINEVAAKAGSEASLIARPPRRSKGWIDDNWIEIRNHAVPKVRSKFSREVAELQETLVEIDKTNRRLMTELEEVRESAKMQFKFNESDIR